MFLDIHWFSLDYSEMTFFIHVESEVCMPGVRECRDMEKKNRIESIFVQVVHVAFERR